MAGQLITEGTQTTAGYGGDVARLFKETRWIDAAGDLVVETTRSFNGQPLPAAIQVLSRVK